MDHVEKTPRVFLTEKLSACSCADNAITDAAEEINDEVFIFLVAEFFKYTLLVLLRD